MYYFIPLGIFVLIYHLWENPAALLLTFDSEGRIMHISTGKVNEFAGFVQRMDVKENHVMLRR